MQLGGYPEGGPSNCPIRQCRVETGKALRETPSPPSKNDDLPSKKPPAEAGERRGSREGVSRLVSEERPIEGVQSDPAGGGVTATATVVGVVVVAVQVGRTAALPLSSRGREHRRSGNC